MRDYIILNGVNSNTITGLLISKLPPITKPKIRTQIEEIDGRDGDIVTKLGYSSYDKTIEIGLYGNYDVNQVISYFNSEGTIVFSNELDKYYNYQILDQIDYEKLIRFKTAKVKLHIQPFKYPIEEIPVEIDVENLSDEGEEMSLNNTSDAPMQINLKGNTSQDGIPTPSNPISVKVVTGNNTINVVGKNVLDFDAFLNYSNVAYTKNNGEYSITNIGSVVTNRYPLNLLPNTQYTLSCEEASNSTSALRIQIYEGSTYKYKIISNGSSEKSVTFTTNSSSSYYLNMTYTGTIAYPLLWKNVMLVKGNTHQPYEAYKSQSYPINLGTIELCKIGDYQDRIYKDSGKWYIEKQIGKVVYEGTATIDLSIGGITHKCLYRSNYPEGKITTGTNGAYYERAKYITNASEKAENTFYENLTNYLIIGSPTDTLDTLKTKFNGGLMYYPLATPIEEEITDSNLINQLEDINNARSYDSITHINQDTNNKPFILNVVAVKKGTDEGIVVNEGNIYSKPIINIEGTGNIGIYLEGNQIFNLDLNNSSECVIDTTNLEAYDPNTKVLLNRKVTGDYNKFKLNVGNNNIKVTGNVTKVSISNYMRWL